MLTLENYALGEWVRGSGKTTELVHAVTGETIGVAGSGGLDFQAMAHFARAVGGPALRALTFHQRAAMLKALAKLPFEQREAFVLHEYSGFAYAEIARMTETTEQNVKMRAYRARVRLRKFIQGWLSLAETDDPASFI